VVQARSPLEVQRVFAAPVPPENGARPPEPVLKVELKVGGYVGALVLSPDGKRVATQTDRYKPNPDGPEFEIAASTIRVWDAATGKELVSLGEVTDPHLKLLSFSGDGRFLLVVERPGALKPRELQFWDALKGEKKKTVELGDKIGRLTFSPDRKSFASGHSVAGPDGPKSEINVGDVETGTITKTITVPGGLPRALAFSADGKLLASATVDAAQKIQVVDLAAGKVTRELEGAEVTGFVSVAFSPDAKVLACAGGKPDVQRWDLGSGKLLPSYAGNGRRTNHVEFSSNGRLLLCAGWPKAQGGEVVLLDAATGKKVQELAMTSASAFSSDNSLWGVGFQDRGVKLWGLKNDRKPDKEDPPKK
jgi:WD40 repeat protein